MTNRPSHHIPTAAAPTPCHPDWQTVSSDLTGLIRTIADRDDLTVIASPGAAHGAPGCYLHAHRVVELDSDICFPGIDPDEIDATDSYDHYCYPAAIGVLIHEAAHHRHSRWLPDPTWPNLVTRAATLLEEVRIEAAQLRRRPADQPWLRCMATDIAFGGLMPSADPSRYTLLGVAHAAQAACLSLGRVTAGVYDLTDSGIARARTALTDALSANLLAQFEQVWTDAIACDDHDRDRMAELASRWCKLLVSPEARKAAAAQDAAEALAEAIAAAGESVEDIGAQIPSPGKSKQGSDGGDAWPVDGKGTGPGGESSAAAELFGAFRSSRTSRPATGTERGAASRLSRAIKKSAQRPRAAVKSPSVLPPGRLRMRGAVAASAQKAAGAMVTAQPWQQRSKQPPPDPTVRVGIALDVSGSMSHWLDPAGAAAWILAKASEISGGSVAATTFGERARALLAPGPAPREVPLPVGEGGTDHADIAIGALIEELDLDEADGNARLLFIISDGYLATRQEAPVAAQCDDLGKTGCAAIQIGPDQGRSTALEHTDLIEIDDPVTATDIIAIAVTDALRSAATTTP